MTNTPCRVFVDANTWISWGYGFSRAEASTLEDLVDHGLIRVVVTDLTIAEIAKRFANLEYEKIEVLAKPEVRAAAKNHLGVEIPEIDRDKMRRSLFQQQLKAVTHSLETRFKAKICSIDTVKPSAVLDDYTHGVGLFGPTAKKDQFPDAFIFAAVAATASEGSPLIVLSQDGDFSQACVSREHIERVNSMRTLLVALGLQPEDEETIANLESHVEMFSDSMADALDNHMLDADDEEEADVEFLKLLKIEDLQVRSLYRIIEGENAYIGFGRCSAELRVRFAHPDWDSAMWDSEEQRLIPFESIEGETDALTREFAFSFLVDIENGMPVRVYDCEVREAWAVNVSLNPHHDYHQGKFSRR